MQHIHSLEELQKNIADIRALEQGSLTNYYPDLVKHSLWIEKGDFYLERINNTLFLIKQSASFWNVFYYSTNIDALGVDLSVFQGLYPDKIMMYDLVGRERQCEPLKRLFETEGCTQSTSFVRMNRMTKPVDYVPDGSVQYARVEDMTLISEQLHQYFNERTEQIPYDEELKDLINQKHVLVCKIDGVMTGFLIFELNSTTLYLRYWFTHPDFRDRKVGSKLLRRFFDEGKDTKRQLFWVIRTNENAIKRYKHYGFKEEDMFDFVMQFN